MKNIYLYIILLIYSNNSYSQGWFWVNHGGSFNGDQIFSICQNNNNDIFLAGNFGAGSPLASYGIFGYDTLNISGTADIMLVKYDENGNEIWAKNWSSTYSSDQEIGGIKYDNIYNNYYLYGDFKYGIQLDTFNLTGFGDNDLFVGKLNENGNFIWAKGIGGIGNDQAGFISFDNLGNIYLSAGTSSGFTLDTFLLAPGRIYMKFDTLGNCIWAKNIFTNTYKHTRVSEVNNHYVIGGLMYDTATFDTINLICDGLSNIFLAKLDTNYKAIWAKNYGGVNSGIAMYNYLTVDNFENIYFIGAFNDSISLGGTTYYSNNGIFFLTKIDPSGNIAWVRQIKNVPSYFQINDIAYSSVGIVYVSGQFKDTLIIGNYQAIASTSSDIFLASFDTLGSVLGLEQMGEGVANGLIIDKNGYPIIGGRFSAPSHFGSLNVGNYGDDDVFLGKHDINVGILETERRSDNSLLIYANPSEGEVHIRLPEDLLHSKIVTLTIFDNAGRLVSSFDLNSNNETLLVNMEKLPAGLYQVSLTDGKKRFFGKMELQ